MRSMLRIITVLVTASSMLAVGFPVPVFAETKEELEAELKKIEAQIAVYEGEIGKTQADKKTLAGKISQLKKEQEKVALQIKSVNLQIGELNKQLVSTETSVQLTSRSLDEAKGQAAEILRTFHKEHQKTLIETLLEGGDLSSLFGNVEDLERLSGSLAERLEDIRGAKVALEASYVRLETEHEEKEDFLAIQTLQRQTIQSKTTEQNKLLAETQGREKQYQSMLADSKKRAQEIKSRIYELLGVNKQITFGEAAAIAEWVSAQTGVRSALLLAVLTQESNLGRNVGTCNRLGDPPSKSWKVVMKPERDQAPFLAVVQELGLNPHTVPVSCPMRGSKGEQIGWGGAMGPAQFIPSTWVLYKNKVAALTGKGSANPWDTRDAFVAAALLLKDNGATGGTSRSEWEAAMRYFSGSTNTRFRFYGDNVLALAKQYESDLDVLG